jgi:hypothetical protein
LPQLTHCERRCVSLYRLDKIRNEICATFDLHINLRPAVIDLVSHSNDAVIGADKKQCEKCNDHDNDDDCDHLWSFLTAQGV